MLRVTAGGRGGVFESGDETAGIKAKCRPLRLREVAVAAANADEESVTGRFSHR